MAASKADFTLTFRRLCDAAEDPGADRGVRDLFIDPTAYDDWADRWRARLGRETEAAPTRRAAMRAVNPAFIARNHRVEEAIAAAIERATTPRSRRSAACSRALTTTSRSSRHTRTRRPSIRGRTGPFAEPDPIGAVLEEGSDTSEPLPFSPWCTDSNERYTCSSSIGAPPLSWWAD